MHLKKYKKLFPKIKHESLCNDYKDGLKIVGLKI